MDRYIPKMMTGGLKRWGLWDTQEGAWWEGEFPTAQYAAGVPYWKTSRAVVEAAVAINRED
jgi:hypothetical protein